MSRRGQGGPKEGRSEVGNMKITSSGHLLAVTSGLSPPSFPCHCPSSPRVFPSPPLSSLPSHHQHHSKLFFTPSPPFPGDSRNKMRPKYSPLVSLVVEGRWKGRTDPVTSYYLERKVNFRSRRCDRDGVGQGYSRMNRSLYLITLCSSARLLRRKSGEHTSLVVRR